jgi:hypothetical protein
LVGAEYDALKTGTNSKKRPKVYRPAVSFNCHYRDHPPVLDRYLIHDPVIYPKSPTCTSTHELDRDQIAQGDVTPNVSGEIRLGRIRLRDWNLVNQPEHRFSQATSEGRH